MNASDPASSNKLTDEQLDALLRSADQELLVHIQANTDPTDALTRLLATPATPADSPPRVVQNGSAPKSARTAATLSDWITNDRLVAAARRRQVALRSAVKAAGAAEPVR